MTAELREAWQSLLPTHPEIGQYLLQRWSLPQRHFHSLAHLQTCLNALAELGSNSPTEPLAIWFHDAVHTNTPGLDELRSAELAAGMLASTELSSAEIDEVCRLIRLTQDHCPDPHDGAGARVCDADLAVLAADRSTYLQSVDQLRREHDDQAWLATRRQQLGKLLATEPLFHTPYADQHWSVRARANLTAELNEIPDQRPN